MLKLLRINAKGLIHRPILLSMKNFKKGYFIDVNIWDHSNNT